MYNQIVTLTIADESDNSLHGGERMPIAFAPEVVSCCGVEMHHSLRTGVWHPCPKNAFPVATTTDGDVKSPFHNIINLIKTKGFDLENELDLD